MLTPGQDHDLACAEALIENADPDALIGDKAYDANPFVDTLTQREIAPVIPPKSNRTVQRACDFVLYCERNLIERLFNHLNTSAPSPRAGTAGRDYNPAQLKTGPNNQGDRDTRQGAQARSRRGRRHTGVAGRASGSRCALFISIDRYPLIDIH